jgi:hypothetical protein
MDKPLVILAYGIAIALGLWGLGHALPGLGYAIATIIEAFGIAAGLAVATASTGLATAGVVAPWVAQAATAALGVAAASTAYLVVVRIVEKGKDHPYQMLVPVFGVLAGLCVDLTKDVLLVSTIEKAFYPFFTGVLAIVGGTLLLARHLAVRIVGGLLPFIPPLLVLQQLLTKEKYEAATTTLQTAATPAFIAFWGTLILGLLIVGMGIIQPKIAKQT